MTSLELMLKQGVDLRHKDPDGMTVSNYAEKDDDQRVISLLKEYDAE
ncbi:MAG: hypothetical protein M2R45_01798 [Verrucomicrobia subdivision 3 bacterium]|nr:hypothetical protein [Limisphaerales bacterium]MCS1415847.1 hypothetical protein [Limisphaerales bacterium]